MKKSKDELRPALSRGDALLRINELKDALAEANARAGAYREVAMKIGHVCHSSACHPVCEMAKYVDLEAHRILGERKK